MFVVCDKHSGTDSSPSAISGKAFWPSSHSDGTIFCIEFALLIAIFLAVGKGIDTVPSGSASASIVIIKPPSMISNKLYNKLTILR
jgi:hypothetical protein